MRAGQGMRTLPASRKFRIAGARFIEWAIVWQPKSAASYPA
jgi:hypothetical protein